MQLIYKTIYAYILSKGQEAYQIILSSIYEKGLFRLDKQLYMTLFNLYIEKYNRFAKNI